MHHHPERILFLLFLLAGIGLLVTPRQVLRKAWDKITALVRPQRNATILIWIIALIPIVHLSYLVRHYSVEVPTLDDWEMASLIVDAHTGHLKWADIFAQQEEARTVLPKLIFILSAAGGRWDVRDLMMLSVICCWLTAAGIFVLLRRSRLGPWATAICFWLAALTIFTPAQYELWIFASGFPSFLPALFLVASLVLLGSDRISTTWKFVGCGVLSVASSFSLPNGLLAWGLTFPALLLMRQILRWRSWLCAWLGLCALCAATYFWSYHKPAYLPAFAPTVSWVDYIRFLLEFLGGGLAYAWKDRPGVGAEVFGAAQLVFFFAVLFYCLRRIRDRAFIGRTVPWFALAFYSLGNAVLATLGRVGYGATYALASRYVTFSVYLTIAVIGLIALVVQDNCKAGGRTIRARRWSYAICFLLLAAYLVPYKACAFNTRFFLRALSAKDRLARAAVLFCPAIDTAEIIKKTAYPNDARPVTEAADALDRLKLLQPPLIRTNRVDALPHEIADGRRASGACETITPIAGNLLRASGWAVLDGKGRPADAVAVAYQVAPDQEWILCALSDSFAMRPEIVKRLGTMEQLWSGWSVSFPQNAVPVNARLSFWAVDADGSRLYRLKDENAESAR
jgi:hypothetical protein